MTLKIEIKMDGAAFVDAPKTEPVRILRIIASMIEHGVLGMVPGARQNLRDDNGNKVGEAKVTP